MSQTRMLARNVIVTFATQLISWGLTFGVTLFLPRYLGDAGLGKLAFAASLVTVAGVLVSLGTTPVLTKEVARDQSRAGELLVAALLLRLPAGLLVSALLTGGVALLHYSVLTQVLVGVTALGMVVAALNDAVSAVLTGQENLPRQSVGILIERCFASLLTIGLIFAHRPISAIAGVGIVSGLVSLVVNLSAFRHLLPTLRWPKAQTIRLITLCGLPFVGWNVFRNLYGATDPVILNVITNDATVGWYAAAARLMGTTLVIPAAFTTALFPTFARLHTEDPAEFTVLARRLFAIVMLCAVPVMLVFTCLPEQLIGLLHYPKAFGPSIPALRVGGLGILMNYAGYVLGVLVIASEGQAKMARTSVYACAIGVPGCVLGAFIGHRYFGNGAVGAVISDVVLEAYLVAAYVRILPRGTFNTEVFSLLGRYVVAAFPAGVALIVAAHLGAGLLSIIPSGVLYLGCCWLMRCFDPAYVALARRMLLRKLQA